MLRSVVHGTLQREGCEMDKHKLQAAFEVAIREFVAYRRKHGGILLPDVFIVESAFEDALHETKLRQRRPEPERIPIIGKKEA